MINNQLVNIFSKERIFMEENEVKQENIEEINEENSGIKISNDVVYFLSS